MLNAYEHACLDEYFQFVDAIICCLDLNFYVCVFAMIWLLPWVNKHGVYDKACLDVLLGFVMWWMLWCNARWMLGPLICDAMIRWMVGLCL